MDGFKIQVLDLLECQFLTQILTNIASLYIALQVRLIRINLKEFSSQTI